MGISLISDSRGSSVTSQGSQPMGSAPTSGASNISSDFALERYKYILQQIHTVNENLYRFLAIYQTLATALIGAVLTLFVGYRQWGVSPSTARSGVVGLLILTSVVGAFTTIFIVVGAFAWFDYRNEECDLTDEMVRPGFRSRPKSRNVLRWYEAYVVIFILGSIMAMWFLAGLLLLPHMK